LDFTLTKEHFISLKKLSSKTTKMFLSQFNSLAKVDWVEWLRMQGHHLPATLEVTGLNPSPGKINLNDN
jgi:hypothetical protein